MRNRVVRCVCCVRRIQLERCLSVNIIVKHLAQCNLCTCYIFYDKAIFVCCKYERLFESAILMMSICNISWERRLYTNCTELNLYDLFSLLYSQMKITFSILIEFCRNLFVKRKGTNHFLRLVVFTILLGYLTLNPPNIL